MEAIVLAGGRGSRLGKLTDDCPKPMLPIKGRPFLEYLFDYWRFKNVDHFILAVNYKYKIIMDHFGHQYYGAKISYSIEGISMALEESIGLAKKYLGDTGTFIVMNGDTIFVNENRSYIDIGTPKGYKDAQRLL